MFKKHLLMLLVVFTCTAGAMIQPLSEAKLEQMRREFQTALSNQRWDSAQELIRKAQEGEKSITAREWQKTLDQARRTVEEQKRSEEKLRKQMEEMGRRKTEVEQKAASEAFALAGERAEEIKKLKEQVRGAKDVGTVGQVLLAKIDNDSRTLAALEKRVGELQAENKTANILVDSLRQQVKDILAREEAVLKESREMRSQMGVKQQLEADLAQCRKQLENVKEGMPTAKANQELRERLAAAEKQVAQLQTKAENAVKEAIVEIEKHKANEEKLSKELRSLKLETTNLPSQLAKSEEQCALTEKHLKQEQERCAEELRKAQETERKFEEKLKGTRDRIKQLEEEIKAARNLKDTCESRIRSAIGKIEGTLKSVPKNQAIPRSRVEEIKDDLQPG